MVGCHKLGEAYSHLSDYQLVKGLADGVFVLEDLSGWPHTTLCWCQMPGWEWWEVVTEASTGTRFYQKSASNPTDVEAQPSGSRGVRCFQLGNVDGRAGNSYLGGLFRVELTSHPLDWGIVPSQLEWIMGPSMPSLSKRA